MPSTSPSWSTLLKLPLASRHATIAAAVTGPMPGSASSCSAVALLRSTKPSGAELFPAVGGAAVVVETAPVTWADRAAHGGWLAGRRRDADDDLFTVGDASGHVQSEQVCTVERPARTGERVGDPRSRIQRDQPRLVDKADHADHHGSSGRGAAATRCRTGRRNHLYRRQIGRDHRRRVVARQREQRHQYRDDTDDPSAMTPPARDRLARPPSNSTHRPYRCRAATGTTACQVGRRRPGRCRVRSRCLDGDGDARRTIPFA